MLHLIKKNSRECNPPFKLSSIRITTRIQRTTAKASASIGQCSSSLEIIFNLQCVFTKGPFNLLVEMLIAVINRVDIFLFTKCSSPAKCPAFLIPILKFLYHPVNLILWGFWCLQWRKDNSSYSNPLMCRSTKDNWCFDSIPFHTGDLKHHGRILDQLLSFYCILLHRPQCSWSAFCMHCTMSFD